LYVQELTVVTNQMAAALKAVEETAQGRVQAAAQEAALREQVRFVETSYTYPPYGYRWL